MPSSEENTSSTISPPLSQEPDRTDQPALESADSTSSESATTGEAAIEHGGEWDDTSNSESNSDSSTSTETPGTISTPRSGARDSGQPVPDSIVTQLDRDNGNSLQNEHSEHVPSTPHTPPADVNRQLDHAILPPLPINTIPVADVVPSWVLYEEDTSTPGESELKEIEANNREINASDTNAVEKDVFTDVDDPDIRPCKKIRLSWVIKGVRGTKEKPNRARIMHSPAVCIDGNWWSIKFFPRGNKSRTAMSAYVRCSPAKPAPGKDTIPGFFKAWEAAVDADLSKVEPVLEMEVRAPEKVDEKVEKKDDDKPAEASESQEPHPQSEDTSRRDSGDNDAGSVSGDDDDRPDSPNSPEPLKDFRISAQLGLAIYNPAEPRTSFIASASHQFYPHQDDWGWDTAVTHWDEIHKRRHGQRQALLRNDTLAIDAYIRIYDDPTQALYWHSSTGETQWDARGLAGVFPVGTRLLYHSPATAGIIAWTLLAPFRQVIQSIDVGKWRIDSFAKPHPLTTYIQLMLFQMRHMKKEELYIRLDNIIHEITKQGESFDSVTTFWEVFRRSIEVETQETDEVTQAMTKIFGSREQLQQIPLLPVDNVEDIQDSAKQAFEAVNFKGELPDFLPLTLKRQSFDSTKREWQLRNDRVRISEALDLTKWSNEDTAKYTLYGFVVHEGDRCSGKFFSVLRPHGPGGKWLVFSDGNGNKVFSYTKKRIHEYEGLDGKELKNSGHNQQVIHTALYIRDECVKDYLLPELEPFKLPHWLKTHLDEPFHDKPDNFTEPTVPSEDDPVSIEIFWDKSVAGQEGKLDLHKLKSSGKAREKEYRQILTADRRCTIADIKKAIAEILVKENPDQAPFKLWAMNHHRLGGVSKGYMYVLPDDASVRSSRNTSLYLALWLTMCPGKYESSDEVLAQDFSKLDGIHVEAPPPPPSPPSSPEPVDRNEISSGEGDETRRGQEDMTSGHDEAELAATSDAEQHSVLEAVRADAGPLSPPLLSSWVPRPSPYADDLPPAPIHGSGEQDLLASADVEQDATQEAVRASVEAETVAETVPIADSILPGPPEDTTPGSSAVLPLRPANTPNAPVTPSEPESIAQAQQSATEDMLAAAAANEVVPPVVHGHLFEASMSNTGDEPSTNSPAERRLSHGLPPLPLGVPLNLGDDQIMLIQPASGDISAEDAALISQMIAADLAAAEQAGQATDNENAIVEGDSDTEDNANIDTRPATPRPLTIPEVYGFLHIFDAENQKFTAHSTFMVPRDTNISTMVRKQMSWDEDKSFHLWKRDGTYRTVGVSSESTFQDASLQDCCEVIVGEHLGEGKMEALKAEAKYVDPGQLMRYIAMVQRRHPIASLTTEEPIEISDFGNDYYHGPVVRGQRHGKECKIITQNGDEYCGPLIAGQKSGGKGKMTYQNGDTYDGDWLDDMKHGQGEFLEKRTGNKYVGGYENDKRWGKGVTYWEQADQQAALCQVCYFEEVDALFYRCGHVVACYACARQCAQDSNGCPVCRKPVEAVVKMYRS